VNKVEQILLVDVQMACDKADSVEESEEPPGRQDLQKWADAAYRECCTTPAELTLRVVGNREMSALNSQYRGQESTTNVLSFPADMPEHFMSELSSTILGDIVICHPVVVAEAQQQTKALHAHYAHLVTHGVLHLCGYDHQDNLEAQRMENLERQILAQQDFADPYQ
jgi:probable rRNA maturation factor